MAGTLVGGAFLSGFINVVFDRLLSPEAANLIAGKKLDQELVERLKTALFAADALVADAERKQFDNEAVRKWLDTLRDAVYKADDLLDHVFTKAATQKEVRTFLPRFLNFQEREMVNKMERVVRSIEDLEKRKYILGLKEISRDNNLSWRETSSVVAGNIYGRENDQEAIIKILNDSSEHQLSVIPVVGMGGVGKTTLAQWVFSNEDFSKGFNLKAWVCVSETFDIAQITKTVIQGITPSACKTVIGGITPSACSLDDLNLLQLDLMEKLSKQKFFIVLDDVWSDDGDSWKKFKAPFQYGAKGSIILLTTRIKEVASVVQTCPPYFLNELSEDDCWSVFAGNACFPESNGNAKLEEIGRKIVKKCKGLPLAAETLGRLLQTKHDVKKWNAVLMTDIWEFSAKNCKIIPALLISYYHLPAYLKRCFIYCSLYPKDYQFDKDELILLWMAEDLLRLPKRGETLEEVGCECFNDLASRLFFKQDGDSDKHFVMHDLLHDLAMFLAGDFYCRLEELGKAEKVSSRTRHLSYGSLSHPISKNFDSIDKVESLRTFLQINFSYPLFSIESAACIILSKLKYLRVLSFHSFEELDVLPDSIGELTHLRYLDLSETSIKTLPESLCDLYNLQTLKLFECHKLAMLPNGTHNLVNLRHLDIQETSLKEMPAGMSKLKDLQLLSYFIVGKHEDNGIKELQGLSNLHGELRIGNLQNVANSSEAMAARMFDKMHIDDLYLKWSSNDDMVPNTQIERDILDKLQPHSGLRELAIQGYRGTIFPNWVGHSSYHNMTSVRLASCKNCCMLPSLGQLPFLESLYIRDFNGLQSISIDFYKNEDDHSSSAKPFPSLKYLTFRSMPCWEVWHQIDSDAFPQLKRLEIHHCPVLKGDLPNHLPALEKLEICRCQQLVSSLPRAPAIRKLEIYHSDKIGLQELPLSLETLLIGGCKVVESMIHAITINHLACLKHIRISGCSSAVSLPAEFLPESLETLKIWSCRRLEFLEQQQQNYNLRNLHISHSCDSLTSFSLEFFPNLENLEIERCENLESLSMSQLRSQHTALHRLTIQHCPNFVSFPEEGLVAPNMTYFGVSNCDKLKSLPCHMNTLLPNLESLYIVGCPEIESFPEGGLPSNLKAILVERCEKLLSCLSSMGVLEALSDLDIDAEGCESVKSFPKVGSLPQLPSLTTLRLKGFPNLETLECNELLRLTSLQRLAICGCPKLENMAGERLPSSLLILDIYLSPLLAEHCKMKHPQIWPKISHIRGIQVDGRWVC